MDALHQTIALLGGLFDHATAADAAAALICRALADRIARVERLIARHIMQFCASVILFLPSTNATPVNCEAIAIARFVLAREFMHQYLALAAHESMVFVGPH